MNGRRRQVTRRIAGALGAAIVASAPAAGAQELTDSVTTLDVTRPLTSRGQLGGVAVDRLGDIWVANFGGDVWRVSPEGGVVAHIGGFYGASGNAIDSEGNLLQSNFFAGTLERVTRRGEVETVASGLGGPVGVEAGGEGELHVTDCNGNRILRVGAEGRVEVVAAGSHFACPNGVRYGPDGALYVVNFQSPHIARIDSSGEVSRFATIPGFGNGHIVFTGGNFYVTRVVHNDIWRVTVNGVAVRLAGGGAPGDGDGPAVEAGFARPNGIAVAPSGDVLYVNELVGEWQGGAPTRMRLRRIDLATLGDRINRAFESGGIAAARESYAAYMADSTRRHEDSFGPINSLAWRLLRERRAAAALEVFGWNVELHPEDPRAAFNLGEGERAAGRTEEAIAAYRRALELDPDHAAARARLAALEGTP